MTKIESVYGLGSDVFTICKTHEPYDFSECCGNCGEDVHQPHASMDRDGDWILLCDGCWSEHVKQTVNP
jgi:hypothetical protein